MRLFPFLGQGFLLLLGQPLETVAQDHVVAAQEAARVDRFAKQEMPFAAGQRAAVVVDHPAQHRDLQGDRPGEQRAAIRKQGGDPRLEPGGTEFGHRLDEGGFAWLAPNLGEDEEHGAQQQEDHRHAEVAQLLLDVGVAPEEPRQEDEGAVDVRAQPALGEPLADQGDSQQQGRDVGDGGDQHPDGLPFPEAAQVKGAEEADGKRQQGDEAHPRGVAVLTHPGALDGPTRERGRRQGIEVVVAQEGLAELPRHPAVQASERQGDEGHAARADEAEAPAARIARRVERCEHQREGEDVHRDMTAEQAPEEKEGPGQRPREGRAGPAIRRQGAR